MQNLRVHNLSRYRDSSYLPPSTFKIVNSRLGGLTGLKGNEIRIRIR
jgi:hypothetical protein